MLLTLACLSVLTLSDYASWGQSAVFPLPRAVSRANVAATFSKNANAIELQTHNHQSSSSSNTKRNNPALLLPPSPADLLKPDGFHFYAYNEKGDMITRKMTIEEIQALIAAGGPEHISMEIQEPQKADEILTTGNKVMDVVEKVQSVLKSALDKPPTSTGTGSISTVPLQANQEWSNILPSILAGDVELHMSPADTNNEPPNNSFSSVGEKYSPSASPSTDATGPTANITNVSSASPPFHLLKNVTNAMKPDSEMKPENSGGGSYHDQGTTSIPYHAILVTSENVVTEKPNQISQVSTTTSPSVITIVSTSSSIYSSPSQSPSPGPNLSTSSTLVTSTADGAIGNKKDEETFVDTGGDALFEQTTAALHETEKVMLPVAVITSEGIPFLDKEYVTSTTVLPTAKTTSALTSQEAEKVSKPASGMTNDNTTRPASTSAFVPRPEADNDLPSITVDKPVAVSAAAGAGYNLSVTTPFETKVDQTTSSMSPTYGQESSEAKEESRIETTSTKSTIDSPVNTENQATESSGVTLPAVTRATSGLKRNSSVSGEEEEEFATIAIEANDEQGAQEYLLTELEPMGTGQSKRPNTHDNTISTVEAILRTVTESADMAATKSESHDDSLLGINLIALLPNYPNYNIQAETVASSLIAGFPESEISSATLTKPLPSSIASSTESSNDDALVSKAAEYIGNMSEGNQVLGAVAAPQASLARNVTTIGQVAAVPPTTVTVRATLEESTTRSSDGGGISSAEFTLNPPATSNRTVSDEPLRESTTVVVSAGASAGDSNRTNDNKTTNSQSSSEPPSVHETWLYENKSENVESTVDLMKQTSMQSVQEVSHDRPNTSSSSFNESSTPAVGYTISSNKTREEAVVEMPVVPVMPVVDESSSDVHGEEGKWQLISQEMAPSSTPIVPAGTGRPGSDITMPASMQQSEMKRKKNQTEQGAAWTASPAPATEGEMSGVESATKWVFELNGGGGDGGGGGGGDDDDDGSVANNAEKASEASLMLEADSTSGAGLESSTRGTSSDIVNFTRLCNEIAFKFWMATNRGLSSGRSLALSPFGMTSLLAMIFLGARGTTSDQMNQVLGLDNVASFNPHLIFQNVTDTLSLARFKEQGVANAAFVREIFADRLKVRKLMPFYKEQAQQFYEGLVAEVNFATINDLVRRRTNLLIRKQTGGRIKDFVRNNAVPLRSPLAAISANVFQTDCNTSSASSAGRDGELYFAVSSAIRLRRLVPVPATVWRTTLLAGYEPTLDATAIALGTSRQLVSTIFLLPGQQGHLAPGDNLDRLEQRLLTGAFQHGAWEKLLKVLVARPGLELQLPKFTHRSIVNATAALKRIGLEEIFSARADLKGINGVGNHLFFTDVLQMNLFSTCGDESTSNARQHHVETYPASPAGLAAAEAAVAPRIDDRRQGNLRHLIQQSIDDDNSPTFPPDGSIYPSASAGMPPRLKSIRRVHSSSVTPRLVAAKAAASVTSTYNKKKISVTSKEAPRLKLDQPFLYFVRHNPTGMILHMGRFNPSFL